MKRLSFLSLLFLLFVGGCAEGYRVPITKIGHANTKERIWLDMDPACGEQLHYSDPDDCLAYFVARRTHMNIVGVSTTGGNAPENDTWEIAQRLVGKEIPLHRGLGGCQSSAVNALKKASDIGPLRIIALGPLTNVSTFLKCHPEAVQNITEVLFVGSRFENESFVINQNWFIQMDLKDLNVVEDVEAVQITIDSGVKLTYIPFEAGKIVPIRYGSMVRNGIKLPDYLHERLRGWDLMFSALAGTDGFLSFDAVAVAFALWPEQFSCVPVDSRLVQSELIVEIEQGDAGENTRCIPQNGDRLRSLIFSALSLP